MTGLILIIALALLFDFINGFHDAANSIATVVSTRVLSPNAAVIWAAAFNFIAFLLFDTHVAGNIAKGVDANVVTLGLVAAGLVGAVFWDLLTWWWGLPTSSSHALLGGLAGAGVAHAGWNVLMWEKVTRTLEFIPIAPLMGFALALALFIGLAWTFRRWHPGRVDWWFRKLQLGSAALYS